MKIITTLFILFIALGYESATAQYSRYIIALKNKNGTPFSLLHPEDYLAAKSIARRNRQQIPIDSTDLPVNPAYLDSIRQSGIVTILNTSKWLNQVLIQTSDAAALAKINAFAFVTTVSSIAPRRAETGNKNADHYKIAVTPLKRNQKTQDRNDYYQYGNSYAQVSIHEGEFLHNKGFRGEGITMAILDAGFYHYDSNPAFDSVRLKNQVLGTWDFVENKSGVTEEHEHGMYCFSTIAANRPGVMVGTAPNANFYLFRTEDVGSEYPVEEQNWVAAAEKADSLGVDLITSSLGYYQFSEPVFDHVYADMNGQTNIITRGAEWAAKKGIFVTNSAGNSGTESWHYIAAPADGEHVLAIGAVNSQKQVAPFSSYGPSYDGRIKPNVASVGWGSAMAGTDGNPVGGSGTSLANPNLAGLIACLWQAFPDFTNADIFDAVQKSADHFNIPDDRTGYGIPNMRVAYEILDRKRILRNAERILDDDWIKAYPVPFTTRFTLLLKPKTSGTANFILYNAAGKKVMTKAATLQRDDVQFIAFSNLDLLPKGVYWLSYTDGTTRRIIRLVK